MNAEDLRKLQQVQLEIMDEIHRVCTDNDISYYMIGGTVLGAVRHGGFIPWDLDIDIAMKRSDYDKFREVCKTKLDSRFEYRDFKNTHNYIRPHALVSIKNTLLVIKNDKFNKGRENYGIYLDIFPLDNAPTSVEKQEKQARELSNIKKLKLYKVATLYNSNLFKKIIKKSISLAMFWTSIDKINAKFDKCMREYDDCETGLLCSMASHYSYKKQCMPEEIYGVPQLMKFEDRMYYAPEQLHEYLTRIYKDYMKLPPKEAQEANLTVFEEVVFDK